MKRAIVFVLVLCASPAGAQQAPPVTPAQQTEKQPVIRHSLVAIGEVGQTPTSGRATDAIAAGDIAPIGLQPLEAGGGTVLRPAWSLAGTFSVAATFEASDPAAVYGLTLGGADGTAFLVRADGAFSIQSVANGEPSGAAWAPVGLRTLERDLTTANRLEVRVTPEQVAFLINGQMVRTIPITAGQLEGPPGIHIGAGNDVAVAGFTLESAGSLLTPVGGK